MCLRFVLVGTERKSVFYEQLICLTVTCHLRHGQQEINGPNESSANDASKKRGKPDR